LVYARYPQNLIDGNKVEVDEVLEDVAQYLGYSGKLGYLKALEIRPDEVLLRLDERLIKSGEASA